MVVCEMGIGRSPLILLIEYSLLKRFCKLQCNVFCRCLSF